MILVFLKGLVVLFLLAPFSIYLLFGIGGGTDGIVAWAKSGGLVRKVYFLYYPSVILFSFVLVVVLGAIVALGSVY